MGKVNHPMPRQMNTQYALLGLLSIQPMSGYDIRCHLQESLLYFWSESDGQIYPTLNQLSAQRFITPVKQKKTGQRERQAYAVTPNGRNHLSKWLAEPPQTDPVRNAFLLKIFFSRFAPTGTSCKHIRRFRIKQEERLETFQKFRRFVHKERADHPDLRFWLIMLDHGVSLCRTQIRWCDRTLKTLCETPEQQNTSRQRSSVARAKQQE
jgi:PadR family transcriptional regulator AphA